jgi:hypothetical protein
MANTQTQIPSARVPFIEGENNLISREWFRYLNNLNVLAGGGTGVTPVIGGGTGLTTIPANGQLLIGNGTGYTLNTLGAGTNIAIANGAGNVVVSFAGILAPSQGGTGISSTPTFGSILVGNGTTYSLGTIAAGPGVSITNDGTNIAVALSGGGYSGPPGSDGQDAESADFFGLSSPSPTAITLRPPFGAFEDTSIQTAPANTAQVMRLNTVDFATGVTIVPRTASFTASIATTVLTVTVATAGTIFLGMTLTGTGVSAGTLVMSQTSGTAGGVGVYVVSISQTVVSTAISGSVASKITVANAGVYNLQWSAQFINTAAAVHEINVWLRQDSVDIVGSAGLVSLPAKHGAFNGGSITGWNYYLSLPAGSSIELWWSTPDAAAYITEYPAGTSPVRPSTASVVATMTFVSAPL